MEPIPPTPHKLVGLSPLRWDQTENQRRQEQSLPIIRPSQIHTLEKSGTGVPAAIPAFLFQLALNWKHASIQAKSFLC